LAAKAILFEDDGTSYDFEKDAYNTWHISYAVGKPAIKKPEITHTTRFPNGH